jgi:hypothetical protein
MRRETSERKLCTYGNETPLNAYASSSETLLSETRCVLHQKEYMKILKARIGYSMRCGRVIGGGTCR